MQSKRTQQIQDQNGQIPKRRRVLRWQPHEEETLRKAIKEYEHFLSFFEERIPLMLTCLSV